MAPAVAVGPMEGEMGAGPVVVAGAVAAPPFNGFPACPDGNEVQAAMHAFQADRALTLRGGMGDHRLPSGILRPASQDLAETLDVADAWRCAGELGKSRG